MSVELLLNRLAVYRKATRVADLAFHSGVNVLRGDNGVGKSTIIDLISHETIRVGAVYDQICDIILDRFDIDFKAIMAAKA